MKKIKKVCINCNEEFECVYDRAKYCSNKCKSAYRRKYKGKIKKCLYCEKEFLSLYHEGNGFTSFCSKKCSAKYFHKNMNNKYLICECCGTEFAFKGSTKAKYCKSCRKEIDKKLKIESDVRLGKTKLGFVGKGKNSKKGKDHHSYKSGIGIYRSIKYQYLIDCGLAIECENCGSTEFLVVHHIDHNRKNNDIKNLQLLCRSCHIKLHCKRDSLGKFSK